MFKLFTAKITTASLMACLLLSSAVNANLATELRKPLVWKLKVADGVIAASLVGSISATGVAFAAYAHQASSNNEPVSIKGFCSHLKKSAGVNLSKVAASFGAIGAAVATTFGIFRAADAVSETKFWKESSFAKKKTKTFSEEDAIGITTALNRMQQATGEVSAMIADALKASKDTVTSKSAVAKQTAEERLRYLNNRLTGIKDKCAAACAAKTRAAVEQAAKEVEAILEMAKKDVRNNYYVEPSRRS